MLDYRLTYDEKYFDGSKSFFYRNGYGDMGKLYFDNLFEPLYDIVGNEKGRVLDVGCAYGYMLKRLPDNYKKYGVDISDHAVSVAKKKLKRAIIKVADVEQEIPFSDNFFDLVICNDVIEHLFKPNNCLVNIHKVLKYNGLFYLNTPNLNWVRKSIYSLPDRWEHHVSIMNQDQLESILNQVGFKVVKKWTYANCSFKFVKLHSLFAPEQAFVCRKR